MQTPLCGAGYPHTVSCNHIWGEVKMKEVVLDSGTTYALLKLAADEGLVEERRDETDAFLERITRMPLASSLKERILDQVVLSPNILTFQPLPGHGLSGELMENGTLQAIEPPDDAEIEFDAIPAELLQGMASARGNDIPVEEVPKRLQQFGVAFDEQKQHFASVGREYPTVWQILGSATSRFVAGKGFDLNLPPQGHTVNDMAVRARYEEAYQRARPLLDAWDEYARLQRIAVDRSALLMIAATEQTSEAVRREDANALEDKTPLGLYKVVATKLGKLTHRTTLRETLQLAEDPATASLRESLPIWLDRMVAEDSTSADLVATEITKALSALAQASRVAAVGKVVGYFAAPVATAEYFLGLPPVAGLHVELISRILDLKAGELTAKHAWLSFGNVITHG